LLSVDAAIPADLVAKAQGIEGVKVAMPLEF
jgi:hypothetical protein